VARRAQRGREPGGDMIRYASAEGRRTLPRGEVATVAIRVRRGERVIVVDVAVRASHDLPCRRQLVRTG